MNMSRGSMRPESHALCDSIVTVIVAAYISRYSPRRKGA